MCNNTSTQIDKLQYATMHLLNIGKLQYALYDTKQIWFINALRLIILHGNSLTSSDCNIARKIIKLFEFFLCFSIVYGLTELL